MTVQEAKEKGYTHKAIMYGVPVYITDDEDCNVIGTNWFNDKIVEIFVYLECTFNFNGCFVIKKGEPL